MRRRQNIPAKNEEHINAHDKVEMKSRNSNTETVCSKNASCARCALVELTIKQAVVIKSDRVSMIALKIEPPKLKDVACGNKVSITNLVDDALRAKTVTKTLRMGV